MIPRRRFLSVTRIVACTRKWRHSIKLEAMPALAAIEQCGHIIDGLSSPTRLVACSGRCCVAAAVGDKSDGFFSFAVFFFLLLDIFVGSCIKPSRNDLVPKTSHFRHLLLPIPHTVVGGTPREGTTCELSANPGPLSPLPRTGLSDADQ